MNHKARIDALEHVSKARAKPVITVCEENGQRWLFDEAGYITGSQFEELQREYTVKLIRLVDTNERAKA